MNSKELNVEDLKIIPLVIAGWLRYLMAVDDKVNAKNAIGELLRNKAIFGVDLYEVGLGDRVCNYFEELTAGVGAVRVTLTGVLEQGLE